MHCGNAQRFCGRRNLDGVQVRHDPVLLAQAVHRVAAASGARPDRQTVRTGTRLNDHEEPVGASERVELFPSAA